MNRKKKKKKIAGRSGGRELISHAQKSGSAG